MDTQPNLEDLPPLPVENPIEDLRDYLAQSQHSALTVLRHFCGSPLEDAPALLDEAVFVGLDMEWWEHKPAPITENGIAILHGRDLASYIDGTPLLSLLKCIQVHHTRIIETCHLSNRSLSPAAAGKYQFGATRYIRQGDAAAMVRELFSEWRCADGSPAPVIFLGHGLSEDIVNLRTQWRVDLKAVPNIVFQMETQDLARQARLVGTERTKLGSLVTGWGVTPHWLHNAGNDIGYTVIVAVLIGLKDRLWPRQTRLQIVCNVEEVVELEPSSEGDTTGVEPEKAMDWSGVDLKPERADSATDAGAKTSEDCTGALKMDKTVPGPEEEREPEWGFPLNSDIKGESLHDIIEAYILQCKCISEITPSPWGMAAYCYRCESPGHLKADCKVTIEPCATCKAATGPRNRNLRVKANGHTTKRCAAKLHIKFDPLPDWVVQKLSKALRADFVRAKQLWDLETLGRLVMVAYPAVMKDEVDEEDGEREGTSGYVQRNEVEV